jgi:hypothetical protein
VFFHYEKRKPARTQEEEEEDELINQDLYPAGPDKMEMILTRQNAIKT